MGIFALAVAYFITSRYFPIEPDVANSPLVWRGLLAEGLAIFKDWAPTPDNWYFTVYPINFIFFALLSDDGVFPLIVSTALFVALSALIITLALYSVRKSKISLIAIICLILFPAFSYTYGFLAHPFSHNSTHFFGVLIFALCLWNIKKNSFPLAIFYSLFSLLPAISDPWFQATYFLPLLLVQIYFSWLKVLDKKIAITFGIFFIFAMSHALPRWMGLPIQHFKLLPVDMWPPNAQWVVMLLGKSMNIFVVDKPAAHIASFVVWALLIIYSFLVCMKQGKQAVFIALFSVLSIAGIIASFIVSYDAAADLSARFFMNATSFGIALTILAFSLKRLIIIPIVLTLFFLSSVYSYSQNKTPIANEEAQTISYMEFLQQHQLDFGYSSYWKMANIVNWHSNGKIHITSVLFDLNKGGIDFNTVRSQTLRSWLTEDFTSTKSKRQFVAISGESNFKQCGNITVCANMIDQQLGKPDEVLKYQDMIIYVYNKDILQSYRNSLVSAK